MIKVTTIDRSEKKDFTDKTPFFMVTLSSFYTIEKSYLKRWVSFEIQKSP